MTPMVRRSERIHIFNTFSCGRERNPCMTYLCRLPLYLLYALPRLALADWLSIDKVESGPWLARTCGVCQPLRHLGLEHTRYIGTWYIGTLTHTGTWKVHTATWLPMSSALIAWLMIHCVDARMTHYGDGQWSLWSEQFDEWCRMV